MVGNAPFVCLGNGVGGMIRTLLIAPEVALAHGWEEVQRVINWLHPDRVVLGAEATSLAVLDALGAGPYDLIWIVSHGAMEGILLADGLWPTQALVQMLQGSGVRCVFLNTCASVGVAIRLHDRIKTLAVVATVGEIGDAVAMRTGALFAQYLAAGKSYREAYELSKQPDSDYVYVNDTLVGNELLAVMDEIRQSEARVKDALVAETLQLRARLDALEAQGARRSSVRRRVEWTIGFVLFYVAYPLAFAEFRSSLGMTYREALIITTVVLALSGGLLTRGMGLWWRE